MIACATHLEENRVTVRCSARPAKRSLDTCWVGREIQFDADALRAFGLREWDPAIYDCLLLAAAVEYADRSIRRRTHQRERQFALSLPVSEPLRWRDPRVKQAAEAALRICTGDRWCLSFRKARRRPPPTEPPLQWRQRFDAAMPFSDGLDSLAASALAARSENQKMLLVRLGGPTVKGAAPAAFDRVPYAVSASGKDFRESSARSRGFKYAVISGIAASLTGAPEVVMPESGQGTLGLVLAASGQELIDRRTHPMFTALISRFLSVLFNAEVSFSHPKLWETKGEVLTEYREGQGDDSALRRTRSCWQSQRQAYLNGKRVQCGICAACLLRRTSLHAAGLAEDAGTYLFEDLSARRIEEVVPEHVRQRRDFKSLLDYADAGIAYMRDIAGFAESPFRDVVLDEEAGHLKECGLGSEREIRERVVRLTEQHRGEWRSFVKQYPQSSYVRIGAF